jgi:multicomponent Na+:H+ antiporter subunit F
LVDIILYVAGGLILLAMIISFFRLLIGPDFMNRTVAFDALTIMALSVVVLLGFFLKRQNFLDVALVYGLLSFLGVMVVARFGEKEL